jgi:hypothetical protein
MRRACSGIELDGHARRWLRDLCVPETTTSMTTNKNARRERSVR